MPATSTARVTVKVSPDVPVGVSTHVGLALIVLSALGTIAAAIKANDTATVVSGIAGVLTAITTLGGRYAQAVAAIRSVARAALPVVTELASEPDKEAGAS